MYVQSDGEELHFQFPGPKLTQKDIQDAETQLGFPMAPELKTLYLSDNGGLPHRLQYEVLKKLGPLFPLDSVVKTSQEGIRQGWLPTGWLAFGEISSDLLLGISPEGAVYGISKQPLTDQNEKVAASLDEFLSKLRSEKDQTKIEPVDITRRYRFAMQRRALTGKEQPLVETVVQIGEADLAAAEARLGFALPAQLRSFYFDTFGRPPYKFAVPYFDLTSVPPTWKSVVEVLPLGPTEDGYSVVQCYENAVRDRILSPGWIQFARDFQDRRTCLGPDGGVYRNCRQHKTYRLAQSVEQFFAQLQGLGEPFNMASKAKFRESGPDLQPGDLDQAEATLGFAFPEQLRSLYLKTNGGIAPKARLRTKEVTNYVAENPDLWGVEVNGWFINLLPLLPNGDSESVVGAYKTGTDDRELPVGAFPLTSDNQIYVGSDGLVYVKNDEDDEDPALDVGTLDEFFLSLHNEDPQFARLKEWGFYDPGPALSENDIAAAEAAITTKLPAELRQLYLKTNGGTTNGREWFLVDGIYRGTFEELLQLGPTADKKSLVDLYQSLHGEGKLPAGFLPIGFTIDAEQLVCVDQDGKVYGVDLEDEKPEPDLWVDGVDELLRGLVTRIDSGV